MPDDKLENAKNQWMRELVDIVIGSWQCPKCLQVWSQRYDTCRCGYEVKTLKELLEEDGQMGGGNDASIEELLEARGKNYGPPILHFACTQDMAAVWQERRRRVKIIHTDKEAALRHGVYMILDKLARAAENPSHMDNWDDIKGYAECIKKVLEGDSE